MIIDKRDKEIIRALVMQKIINSKNSCNETNIIYWTKLNDLKMIKPMVFIKEMPLNEIDVNGFMELKCNNDFLRTVEKKLKTELFEYKVGKGNRIVKNYYEQMVCYKNTGFGIEVKSNIIQTDGKDIVSKEYIPQICSENDLYKIKNPIITIDLEETFLRKNILEDIFGDLMEIKITGIKGYWFAVWDDLVQLTGVEPVLIDMYDNPNYISRLVEKYVDANCKMLEQFNELGIWGSNIDSLVGSGGYGYTNDLPKVKEKNIGCNTKNMWGCANAQIFSTISPKMHWDYSLKYELKWLKQFGLVYYGCCEPLELKMDNLSKIPNLRKISCSPWCDLEKMAEKCNNKYVMSIKPNPSIFMENFNYKIAKIQVKEIIKKVKGCNYELILKDISTVNNNPEAITIWNDMAMEAIDEEYS